MRDARRPRLLLLLPTTTYRAEAFVDAARRLDVDLAVASEYDSAFSAAEPERLLTLDFADPEGAAERVRGFAGQRPVDAVFGVDDRTALVAAHANRTLGIPHSPVEAVAAAGDKHRQRALLAEAGVSVPAHRLVNVSDDMEALAREIRYPCVLKPLHLAASRGVMRANDSREFCEALARMKQILAQSDVQELGDAESFLVEDYVPGPEFAVEGVLREGRLELLALFDKPDSMDGPVFEETIYVTPSSQPLAVQRDIVGVAESAAQAIGLVTGPVHVEVRYNDRGAWLIELAARPIGGKCGQVLRFGRSGEISLEQFILGRALGRYHECPNRESSAAAVMMLPVPAVGVLRESHGVIEALSVPHVTDVIVTAHRGQSLAPLPEQSVYLGFVFARAETSSKAVHAVRRASEMLEFVIE
jgi:biotin carboxylase